MGAIFTDERITSLLLDNVNEDKENVSIELDEYSIIIYKDKNYDGSRITIDIDFFSKKLSIGTISYHLLESGELSYFYSCLFGKEIVSTTSVVDRFKKPTLIEYLMRIPEFADFLI